MSKTLHHGTNNESVVLHLGFCLTPSADSAENYGENVTAFELELSGLNVQTLGVEAWNRDEQIAIGDSAESLAELAAEGVDVVVYTDEDPFGRTHQTYRLVSDKALAALVA